MAFCPCASGSDLFAVSIAGGAPRHLADDPPITAGEGPCASSVVEDASAVYFAVGSTIKKASR